MPLLERLPEPNHDVLDSAELSLLQIYGDHFMVEEGGHGDLEVIPGDAGSW